MGTWTENTVEKALRCMGFIIKYVKRGGGLEINQVLVDVSNVGGMMSNSMVVVGASLYCAMCTSMVSSPLTIVRG